MDLLNAFTPFDEVEAGHHRRMLDLAAVDGDPLSRSHFVPGHFTASSFVLSPDGGGLLLIFHGKLHRWLQPGGHVDPEDTDLIAAARREVQEETGLKDLSLIVQGVFDVDIHPIPALRGEPPHEHFDVRFLFRSPAAGGCVAGSDAKEARWYPLDEVTPQLSDASVMRAVGKMSRGMRAEG